MKELNHSLNSEYFSINPYRLIIPLFLFFISINSYGDNLKTATSSGSSTTSVTDEFVNVTSVTLDLGTNVSDVEKVMVIATYEVMAADKNGHKASFRVRDSTNGVSSETLVRHLERTFDGDKGIGSIVYIFNVSANSGDVDFYLQHATSDEKYNNTTSGTIAAIALSTETNHYQLSSDLRSISTSVIAGDNVFTTVTGFETNAISLPTAGSVFIAASINSRTSTGLPQAGQWKLQQRKGLLGTWTDIGQTISRTITNNSDEGIASVGMISEDLSSADYYYRLQHKGPISTTIETLNTSLIAVSLGYDDPSLGGRTFPTFNADMASISTISPSLIPALSHPGTPASNTDLFLYAQYNMSANGALDAPVFDISVTDGDLYSYSSGEQSRTLSSDTDMGSGASVGIAQSLLLGTEYTASLRHQSDGSIILTTSNITLSGFQTTDQASEGYWTGNESTVWNNILNWADGIIPLSTTYVTIADKTNDPIIGAIANSKSLSINSGLVTIAAGGKLTVAEEITNEVGASGLIIESDATGDGSLIFGSGLPSATVSRYITPDAWHMVSPIVDGLIANDFYIDATHDAWLIYHTESTNSWDYITDLSAALVQTTGYMYWVDASAYTVDFTGAIAALDQSLSLSKTGVGFNALGNPFTSALDWDLISTGITTGAAYVWDDNYNTSGDYRVSGGDLMEGIIPMGQGFFVQANSAGSFTIPEAARVHSGLTFYKSTTNEPSQYVRIQLDGDGYGNTVFVGFPENGTDEFDYRGDATKLYSSSTKPQLFTVENGKELCINANAPLTEAGKTLPLHLVQVIDGNYALSISNLDQLPNTDIILEDLQVGVTQDFIQNPIYNFSATEADNPERFLLHFSPPTINGNEDIEDLSSGLYIYSYGKTVYIRSRDKAITQQGFVIVTDLLGREIVKQSTQAGELVKFNLDLNNTYVIVKFVKEGAEKTQTVFIK